MRQIQMTYDDAISLLQSDIMINPYNIILDSWLDTTLLHIERIFGYGTEVSSFSNIRSDYRIGKIGTNSNGLAQFEKKIYQRAVANVKGLMDTLNFERVKAHEQQQMKAEQQQKLQQQRLQQQKLQEEQARKEEERIRQKGLQQMQQQQSQKKQGYLKRLGKSFAGISGNAWAIIVPFFGVCVTAAYFLGKDIGGASMERTKNRLEDENTKLVEEKKNQSDSISILKNDVKVLKDLNTQIYQVLTKQQKDSLDDIRHFQKN